MWPCKARLWSWDSRCLRPRIFFESDFIRRFRSKNMRFIFPRSISWRKLIAELVSFWILYQLIISFLYVLISPNFILIQCWFTFFLNLSIFFYFTKFPLLNKFLINFCFWHFTFKRLFFFALAFLFIDRRWKAYGSFRHFGIHNSVWWFGFLYWFFLIRKWINNHFPRQNTDDIVMYSLKNNKL